MIVSLLTRFLIISFGQKHICFQIAYFFIVVICRGVCKYASTFLLIWSSVLIVVISLLLFMLMLMYHGCMQIDKKFGLWLRLYEPGNVLAGICLLNSMTRATRTLRTQIMELNILGPYILRASTRKEYRILLTTFIQRRYKIH